MHFSIMKIRKLFISLFFFTLVIGGFFFAVIKSNSSINEPAIVEAWDINVKLSVQTSYYSSAAGKIGSALLIRSLLIMHKKSRH